MVEVQSIETPQNQMYDLYLYFMETADKLSLIKSLSYDQASELAEKWFRAGDNRDYMLVTEDSKPYLEEMTSVEEVSVEWIDSQ